MWLYDVGDSTFSRPVALNLFVHGLLDIIYLLFCASKVVGV
jgi:hypothetical protein